ncbi:TPA: hypothetical protein I9094_002573 [Clostridium perfringens]|nr:hypothetical protein [Clostridium perfringens]HAT4347212.1 hypothetical protein [Clostridium perfringens]
MKQIYLKKQLKDLNDYPAVVLKNIFEIIAVLVENYGVERDVNNDLGGYILIVENIVDVEILKREKFKGLVPEYTDIIECSEGVNYTSSLFLLSSDFSVVVIANEELSKILLE